MPAGAVELMSAQAAAPNSFHVGELGHLDLLALSQYADEVLLAHGCRCPEVFGNLVNAVPRGIIPHRHKCEVAQREGSAKACGD